MWRAVSSFFAIMYIDYSNSSVFCIVRPSECDPMKIKWLFPRVLPRGSRGFDLERCFKYLYEHNITMFQIVSSPTDCKREKVEDGSLHFIGLRYMARAHCILLVTNHMVHELFIPCACMPLSSGNRHVSTGMWIIPGSLADNSLPVDYIHCPHTSLFMERWMIKMGVCLRASQGNISQNMHTHEIAPVWPLQSYSLVSFSTQPM